jgi:hypothetical protein
MLVALIAFFQCASISFAEGSVMGLPGRELHDVAFEWGRAIDLGPGGYARVHRLGDARFMAAYSAGGGVVARFAPPENLRE